MEQQGTQAATLKKAANKRSGRGSESIRDLQASDRRAPPAGSTGTGDGLAFSRMGGILASDGQARCGGRMWMRLDDLEGTTFRYLGTPCGPGPRQDRN